MGMIQLMFAISAVVAAITNQSATASNISNVPPGPSTARYALTALGEVQTGSGSGSASPTYTTVENWLISGAPSQFEVRATISSGAVSLGTVGSWLSLSTSREWGVTTNGSGGDTKLASLIVEIRDAATLTVLTSASISLDASEGAG